MLFIFFLLFFFFNDTATTEIYTLSLHDALPISKPAEKVQGRFVRQTGGSGQYGDVTINIAPQEPGAGYEFTDKIVGGKIPKEYIPAVNAGIQEALGSGVIAGYPVVDVKVELVDGSYHDVD